MAGPSLKHQGTGARVQLSDLGVEEKLVEAGKPPRNPAVPVKRGDEIPYSGGDVLSQWAKGWYLGI